jgi:hypothetical protein
MSTNVTKVQAKLLHKSNENVLKRALHIGMPELKLRVAHLSSAAVQTATATHKALANTVRDIILAVCVVWRWQLMGDSIGEARRYYCWCQICKPP